MELFRTRGRHSFTFGGGLRDLSLDVLSQQDPRGGFTFTGAATGSDVADFLLGLPRSSTIAFGNADKRLRQWLGEAYVNDDLRVSATLTLNLGLRWEFESPMTEGAQPPGEPGRGARLRRRSARSSPGRAVAR